MRPEHLSYSSASTYQKCPKSYQLGRIQGVKGPPAWWNIGGSAVHAVLDHFDYNQAIKVGAGAVGHMVAKWDLETAWRVAFAEEIANARDLEPDMKKWRVKRRSSEGHDWWNAEGPRMCQRYIDWRLRSPSWRVWTTPDGEPAIELELSGRLPGCDAPIVGRGDRIFEDTAMNELWIVDFKSGSGMASDFQLGKYRSLLMEKFGAVANKGATWRVRQTDKKAAGIYPHALSLEKWTPEYAGRIFGQVDRARKAGAFTPNTSDEGWCRNICDVSHACYAMGGEQAALYDPDSPGYQG